MSNDSQEEPHQLPDHPNLRHLKDQAKDLLKAGGAVSITDAQFKIARLYGFSSWPKLKAHVDSLKEVGRLKQKIDAHDSQPHAARGSARLWPKWPAHLGGRMPYPVGTAEPGETGDGEVDDRERVGCASGGRCAAHARGAQCRARSDDGITPDLRRGCER